MLVKYLPKGRNIEVRYKITGNIAYVSVKDEGLGILLQDVDKLFERHYLVRH